MKRRKRSGAAAVEFAAVSPLFLLILLGSIDMGQMVNVHQKACNAAREGARVAARAQSTVSDVENAVETYLADVLPALDIDSDSSPLTIVVKNSSGTVLSDSLSSALTGTEISVEVAIHYNSVRAIQGLSLLNDRSIVTKTVMRRE